MVSEKSIFWCGSILNHAGLKRYKGEAPSATQWSRGLIGGINQQDIDVKLFAPIWDSLFPKGKLFPVNKKYLDDHYNQIPVHYINAPLLRTKSVATALTYRILKYIKTYGAPLAIFNYNTYPHYCKAIKAVKRKYPDIIWVNLVLDLDDPLNDNWLAFKNDVLGSDGCVFLSWWGYENAPIKHKIHLDSGWNGNLPKHEDNGENVFIYAGKLSDVGGIATIIEAIKHYPQQDVYFDFYGKGHHAGLEELASKDNRVRIRGFVSDEELDKACSHAKVFLSPRDLNFQGTRMVFPSKNLFYLTYRKPIISQMLPGLSPEYEKIMLTPPGDDPKSWSETMLYAMHMDEERLQDLANRIESFLYTRKWENQASKLMNFVKELSK